MLNIDTCNSSNIKLREISYFFYRKHFTCLLFGLNLKKLKSGSASRKKLDPDEEKSAIRISMKRMRIHITEKILLKQIGPIPVK